MIKRACFRIQSDDSGLVAYSLTVPGTFTTIDPNDSAWSGRKIMGVQFKFETAQLKRDKLLSFIASDDSGKVPVQYRAAMFPSYPELRSWTDEALDASLQGLFLEEQGFTTLIPTSGKNIVPSEILLKLQAQTQDGRQDWLLINMLWDDGT